MKKNTTASRSQHFKVWWLTNMIRVMTIAASVLTLVIIALTFALFWVYKSDPGEQQGVGQLIGAAASSISFIWIIVQLQLQYRQLKSQDAEMLKNTEEIQRQGRSIEETRKLTRVQTIIQLKPSITRALDRVCRQIVRDLSRASIPLAEVTTAVSEYPFISCLDNTQGLIDHLVELRGTPYWRNIEVLIGIYVEQYQTMMSFEAKIPEEDRILDDLLLNSPEHHLNVMFRRLTEN